MHLFKLGIGPDPLQAGRWPVENPWCPVGGSYRRAIDVGGLIAGSLERATLGVAAEDLPGAAGRALRRERNGKAAPGADLRPSIRQY